MQQSERRISIGAVIIYGLAALAVLIVALSGSSEPRSARFWGALAWTEILILLVFAVKFGTLFFALKNDTASKTLAVLLPSSWVLVALYAVTSFAVLQVYVQLDQWSFIQHWHIAIQVLLLFLAATIIYAVQIIFEMEHRENADRGQADCRELLETLKAHASSLARRSGTSAATRAELDRFNAMLTYSAPPLNKLAATPVAIEALISATAMLGTIQVDTSEIDTLSAIKTIAAEVSVQFRKIS